MRTHFWILITLVLGMAASTVVAGPAPIYKAINLGTLGGHHTDGSAVNASGQVTGESTVGTVPAGGSGAFHPYLFSDGVMKDLGTLGGDGGVGLAINSSGQVVGQTALPSGDQVPFLYSNGTLMNLGTFGGASGSAQAINSSGQVTGEARPPAQDSLDRITPSCTATAVW